MAHDVFICYSSKDKTTADAVCAVLESEGIRCWIAPRDILVGMSYGEAIVDAIHNAKALVLVFSGHANASPQIEREVERAINKRIPVIPLRIEDVAPDKALEYFLSTPHWLDAFTPPLERHLRNLAAQIHRLIVTDDKAAAAKDAGAIGASPFKTVQTPEPTPEPPPEPKPATPSAPMTDAVAAAAARTSAPRVAPNTSGDATAKPFMPQSAAGGAPKSSPAAFFDKLDTPQKIGIGAAGLAVLLGIGWFLSTLGNPSPAPSGVVGPNGGITVTDDGQSVRVGQDGVQVGPSTAPPPGSGDRFGQTTPPSNGGGRFGDEPSASAGPVVERVTNTDLGTVLDQLGFTYELGTDRQGDPMIQGSISGQPIEIYFYRCDKNVTPRRCLDVQFHSVFSGGVSPEQINNYNRDNRFGQAYFMTDGRVGLDMSATFQGGVARDHIKEVVDWWKVTVTNFRQRIGG